jgi:hypothetical protein
MVRMLPRLVTSVLLTLGFIALSAVPVTAQDHLASTALASSTTLLPNAMSRGALFPITATNNTAESAFPATAPDFSRLRRPALLPAMYAATIALQAMDAHSTMKAIGNGATEANPMMKGVVGNHGALLAVKAGAAAGTIYFAERLWRRNRVAAVVLMAAVNGATAAIVAHNYKVASRVR